MKELVLVVPYSRSGRHARTQSFLDRLRENPEIRYTVIEQAEDLHPMKNCRILFVLNLGNSGMNLEWAAMTIKIRRYEGLFFDHCTGAVITDSLSELYSKSAGRALVLTANLAGCTFPGRCLVEGTGSLHNFDVTAKLWEMDREDAYQKSMDDLLVRLLEFVPGNSLEAKVNADSQGAKKRPRILVLHASIWKTSNTMKLWSMVRERLEDEMDIQEISLRNGEICDCSGCPFTMCMHYSEKGQCYYGGVMVEQVYPAVEECDAIVMIAPNYNDAISANLSAFVNRLTSLYRKRQFYDKYMFALIVSGYSGGDILASQLISGLNMNKTFILPANFAMMETANDPGSICQVDRIREKAESFANNMREFLL